jgi:Tol biopolymer transport system component
MNRRLLLAMAALAGLILVGGCRGGNVATQTVRTIAFVSNRDGNDEIYVVDSDGSGLANLTNNPASDSAPTWSPDGKRIAFQSDRDSEFGLIYVMNADGSNVTRLTDESPSKGGLSVFDPLWSPDGKKIAFSAGGSGFYGVYVMNPDGSDQKLISAQNDDHVEAWSPDSKQIAFVSGVYGNDLWVVNADGTGLKALTSSGDVYGFGPASWSPDSKQLLFEESNHLHLVGTDGTPATDLTSNLTSGDFDTLPVWSPDGAHIGFTSVREDGESGIYLIDVDGSNVTRLTKNTANEAGTFWSPDGSKILFASDGDLYVMNSDGTDQMRLTTNAGLAGGFPVWSPVGYKAGASVRVSGATTTPTTTAPQAARTPETAVPQPTAASIQSPRATSTPRNTVVDPDLRVSFQYHEGWSPDSPCEVPLDAHSSVPPCSGIQRYRSISPAESATPQGDLLFVSAIASPGDPEIEIFSAQPFNGIYVTVSRLPRAMSESEFAQAVTASLNAQLTATGASLIDTGTRRLGGVEAVTYQYELASWGPCIYMGAGGCSLATGRVWDQALLVQGDLAYLISCEGDRQRTRLPESGPPPTQEPFGVLQGECQIAFDSFMLPATAP